MLLVQDRDRRNDLLHQVILVIRVGLFTRLGYRLDLAKSRLGLAGSKTSLHNLLVFSWQKRPKDWCTGIAIFSKPGFAITVSGSKLETFIALYLWSNQCVVFLCWCICIYQVFYTQVKVHRYNRTKTTQKYSSWSLRLSQACICWLSHMIYLHTGVVLFLNSFQSCHVLPFQ